MSLALADGARGDHLKWVTHGKQSTVMDLYTTLPWATLCEAVACLRVDLRCDAAVTVAPVTTERALPGAGLEDRANLANLQEIQWSAVAAQDWRSCKDGKQAEFLLEYAFPWHLIERIGVESTGVYTHVVNSLPRSGHRPAVEVRPDWYY